MKSSIITALDIGSAHIRALIAQITGDGRLEIIGLGETTSEGMDKGLIKDIQAVAACIKAAMTQAEEQAQCDAENIYINITDEHIRSHSAIGRISIAGPLSNEPAEITQEHIAQVINDAKNSVKVQKGFERLQILHGLPQYFDIDDQNEIANPINMSGYHLTSHVLLVMADITSIRNLLRCVEVAGYQVDSDNIVLSHLAASLSTLSDDERKLGAVLIDMGGGCCDIAFYNKGNLISTAVVPAAGNDLTRDLAIGLRTTMNHAEYIKTEYGNAIGDGIDINQEVTVDGISGRSSSVYKVAHVSMIIQKRLADFSESIYQFIKSVYLPEFITAGIVITGGTAKLKGIERFISTQFNMPVKLGYPDLSRLSGPISRLEDPIYATAIGLLYYAMDQNKDTYSGGFSRLKINKDGLVKKIGSYLKNAFS